MRSARSSITNAHERRVRGFRARVREPIPTAGARGSLAVVGGASVWSPVGARFSGASGKRSRRRVAAGVCAALMCLIVAFAAFGAGSSPRAAGREGLLGLPAAAQGPISAALGRQDPAYRMVGLAADNPAQRLSARFARAGVTITAGSARVGIALRAVGRASATNRLGAVAPSERANRVSYAHNGVSEWWENGPIGLEQNFQIAQRPAGTRALTLSLAITGPIALAHGELSLAGGLRYAGLRANDANGHPLPAWFELHHGRALIRVNDHGARYPIHIDPFVQQARLTASDATSFDGLGYSVAISGNTVVVGSPYQSFGNDAAQGAVYVFVMPGGGWATDTTQTAELTASDGATSDELGLLGRDLGEHDRRRRALPHGGPEPVSGGGIRVREAGRRVAEHRHADV